MTLTASGLASPPTASPPTASPPTASPPAASPRTGSLPAQRSRGADGTSAALRLRARPRVDLDVVVPAFNEERRLADTLKALTTRLAALPVNASIVVVDNGSADGTARLAREWAGGGVPVHLIGCSRQGKGAAVRRGIISSSARWVGFCDADLATSLDALDPVLAALQGGAEVVIGSRRTAGAEVTVAQAGLRRAGGNGFRRLVTPLVPGVSDTQCGFKFFDGRAGRALLSACRCDGFAFDVEVLARAVRAGLTIVEVPVSWQSQPGSTFSALHDGRRAARELLAIRGRLRRRELALDVSPPEDEGAEDESAENESAENESSGNESAGNEAVTA